jgi:hypothetical protein
MTSSTEIPTHLEEGNYFKTRKNLEIKYIVMVSYGDRNEEYLLLARARNSLLD